MPSKQNPNEPSRIFNRIFSYISEVGSLMFMPRSHNRSLINTFDSIASHSHHTAIIAYCIARMENLSHEDGMKAIAMGVLHDTAESRTNDLDFISKNYTTRNEPKATEDQIKDLPFKKDLLNLIHEYEKRDTLIAKCTKDADILDQMYQEWILMHTGNKMAEKWFKGSKIYRIPYLRTSSAKKIALEMDKTHPHQWWWQDLVEAGVNQTHLNGHK